MSKSFRKYLVAAALIAVGASQQPAAAHADEASPPFVANDAPWLTTVNYYRSMSGLAPVTEDARLSTGAVQHSCYMLQNGISHTENSSLAGATPEGAAAGERGNVAVSSNYDERARSHIELWMTGPFHAVGVLRPNLTTVGFGKCDRTDTPTWHSAATLEVISGLQYPVVQTDPILFPGNGTTTNLFNFRTESPDPRGFCGFDPTAAAGLPVMALMPESAAGAVSGTIVGPAGPLDVCLLNETNTTGTAQQLLHTNNVVVAMPRKPLTPGRYDVSVTTATRTVAWSFTVDPAAAGTPTTTAPEPLPVASPSMSTSAGLQPVVPVRLVDTREGLGATPIVAMQSKRIQIGGRGDLPTSAPAISMNLTAVDPSAAGYVTVWNCADARPVVATVNFGAHQTVSNAASVPMDTAGGICVYAPVDLDLVIDVNGYYSTSAAGRYRTVTPTRLLDTRLPSGGRGVTAGVPVTLHVTGIATVPNGASAVSLNVAAVDPSASGFVTVWPCDQPRPTAASLNPEPGRVTPNLVVAPVGADGNVCFFSSSSVDLVVDVVGFLSDAATARFTPSAPFRFTDTRASLQPQLNAGTGGARVAGGRTLRIMVAGQRGIPAGITAISANIAVVDAAGAGYVTVWPCGAQPNTANVNYEAATAISSGAQLPISASGELCVFTNATANIVIDINGWWS